MNMGAINVLGVVIFVSYVLLSVAHMAQFLTVGRASFLF